MTCVLAIDQGTTSSRAVLFDGDLTPVAMAQQEFRQIFPKSGWVEHDPHEIWQSTVETARRALKNRDLSKVAAIGITNQRETTLVWDRHSGTPVYNAIVWQDRRTADECAKLKQHGLEAEVSAKTGLLLDPYFSATKLTWILDNVAGARARAENGELLFGTVDCFLIWKLTGGQVHATDATNASRTLLYNIHTGCWDDDLLSMFNIPRNMLPQVRDCAADFGQSAPDLLGLSLPICGVAGDQQAATVGQACFRPGMMKSTYGTGCFALLNTGQQPVRSTNRLLTTIAYQLRGQPTYALEGSIFIAGAVVQWLRDGLKIIDDATQSQTLAAQADPEQSVLLVPAFTGLGAPYWDAQCRGAMFGLTRNSGPAEICKAALESVAFQTRDLLEAMKTDWVPPDSKTVLRVDGGMSSSDWSMQNLANQLGVPVDRPKITETTALGAAYLAGLQAGIYPEPTVFEQTWALEKRFLPDMPEVQRTRTYARWKNAVQRTLGAI